MMTSEILISVIIPVYNAEQYVGKSIESVLAQTYENWECICVDDGCTDGSGKVLDSYAKRDPRIKVLHVKNGGEASARNIGMATARGCFLTFCDNDDILHPRALETLVAVQKKTGARFIKFGITEVREFEGSWWRIDDCPTSLIIDYAETKISPTDFARAGQYVFFDREIGENVKWVPNLHGLDGYFCVRAIREARKIVVLRQSLVQYLVRGGSQSSWRTLKMYTQLLKYFVEITNVCFLFPRPDLFRNNLRAYVRGGITLLPNEWTHSKEEFKEGLSSYFAMLKWFCEDKRLFGAAERSLYQICTKYEIVWPILLIVVFPRRIIRKATDYLLRMRVGHGLVCAVKRVVRG